MSTNAAASQAEMGESSGQSAVNPAANQRTNSLGSSTVADSALPSSSAVQRQASSQQKQCWVCFATEEDDPDTEWVRPCRCRGSTMWVHQKCLQRWVDEKQRGNTFAAVACGSCGFIYTIIYPPATFAMLVLEKIDRLITKMCPLMTGGLIIISLYWTAVTYGAITVMQIMGSERGMQALEKADPVLLLVGLPTIPIMLVTIKMIRWEHRIVQWLRDRYISRRNGRRQLHIPDGAAVNGARARANDPAAIAQQQIIRDAASATRVLCGALALPTIAVTVGKLVFGEAVAPPLRRACYGAALFLAVRGATKIYFKYQQLLRQQNRMIIDYRPADDRPNQDGNGGNGDNGDQGHAAAAGNAAIDIQP